MKNSMKILSMLTVLMFVGIIAAVFFTSPAASISIMEIQPLAFELKVSHLGGAGSILALPFVLAAAGKTSADLQAEKRAIWDKAQALHELGKTEKRELTADENTLYDEYMSQLEEYRTAIKRAQATERGVAELAGKDINRKIASERNKDKEVRQYSLVKAIRSLLPNEKLEGVEKEMHEEAQMEARKFGQEIEGVGVPLVIMEAEKRDFTATGGVNGSEGGVFVPTAIQGFIPALLDKLVFKELGSQFLTGLTGNSNIPVGSAVTGAWEGENDTNAEIDGSLSKLALSPNRYGAFAELSKQLLFQSSFGVQSYVEGIIQDAIALAVQQAGINGAGAGNVPEGILNTDGIGAIFAGDAADNNVNANGKALVWNDLVNLEAAVALQNADSGSLAYLTNSKVRAAMKKTKLDAGSGLFLWDKDNTVNGHKTAITNQVPYALSKGAANNLSALIFGNFKDLMFAQYGGLDIVVDPYTQAKNAMVNIIVNSWWDVLVLRAKSFASAKDIIA